MPLAPVRAAALAAVLFVASQSAPADDPTAPEDILVALVGGPQGLGEKAFIKSEYKHVRAGYSKYFEAKYGRDLKLGIPGDATRLFAWLDDNPEIKETLLTALDPESDNLAEAMIVFRDLWKAHPEAVKAHPNEAIAAAVVWDNPKQAPYDYRPHQRRTKSTLPEAEGKIGPAENFKYLIDRDAKLKGPQLQLPWEFLVHVVNHKTPADERDWAVSKYLPRRTGVGTVYKDIEYDKEMLRTQSEKCKLNDKPYTLPSIREFGGVCAMQADFAARVAKSLGVPAEYVGGEANTGGLHAWVMWAEVKAVNKDAVTFTLESFGRYNIDQYYVGTLRDPRTGRDTTDRQLEQRLTAVGQSPANSRHADLLMRAFPIVRDKKQFSTKLQLVYLNRVLNVYPMCESAWVELAAMHKDGKLTDTVEATRLVDKALLTFAKFPDFSWKVVDDLLTPQKEKLYRTRTFERMVLSYETLGRPDLACEARLKLVDYQADAKEHKKAFDGLAATIRKFPSEGRYVPKMMTRLQEVAKEMKGGPDLLAKFYLEILPRIPARRGDEVSKFCVTAHEQAISFLKENGKAKDAAVVEQSLGRVKGK